MNKTALITGSAKRLGKAIALQLAELGYDIALHYHRSSQFAKKTAAAVRAKGRRCQLFQYDLTNQQETEDLIPTVWRHLGKIDVLVNNASIFGPSSFTSSSMDSFDHYLSINFKAPYILCAQFAKYCKKGLIINILDAQISQNQTKSAFYLLSKKSLADLTKMAALEFAPHIRVNAIAPGAILPPPKKTAKFLQQRRKRIPLKIKGDMVHITSGVRFLVENDFITGQILFIDGGEHLL